MRGWWTFKTLAQAVFGRAFKFGYQTDDGGECERLTASPDHGVRQEHAKANGRFLDIYIFIGCSWVPARYGARDIMAPSLGIQSKWQKLQDVTPVSGQLRRYQSGGRAQMHWSGSGVTKKWRVRLRYTHLSFWCPSSLRFQLLFLRFGLLVESISSVRIIARLSIWGFHGPSSSYFSGYAPFSTMSTVFGTVSVPGQHVTALGIGSSLCQYQKLYE